ncbi:transcriptional regulator, GntR family protein [Pseudooceanicola batsensis HTCC2597]|uniref:Transcriptional regulator, GntR family protein n=1 Tax=Pseudooceanicola batsensis (strain ATCC BAA-863 / DSM 15984 / KCTC 12145 / HTCC2597) TaxID=252305 RepID=A3U0D3_PSEBH|nr:GntR family transcriptional regulator [Pseudooceanicola batsensis]EAQ02224.1 transcriptional regulator, GntR family protein [Pseudooceanicola batsensis HTCC2597]
MLDDLSTPAEGLSETLSLDGIDRPADRAYVGIRRAILSGVLKGGAHLGEEALARMTGTSRTPVRDALRRLVGEGLARDEGRSRFVAEFPYEEVAVIFDIRARLEGYAARLAAASVTQAELDELARLVHEIDNLAGPDGTSTRIQEFARLNNAFHAQILTATRSPQMQNLSAQATAIPLELIKQFVWSQAVNIERSNRQHRDILDALTARNANWAENIMSAHILSTKPTRTDGTWTDDKQG